MKKNLFGKMSLKVLSCLLLFIVSLGTLSACYPEYREFVDDGLATKKPLTSEKTTGGIQTAPVGEWTTSVHFYKLGFTQISDLRIDELAELIDNISDNVRADMIFKENGEFLCLTDRQAVIDACRTFGAGFLDVLNEADIATMAKMKNMSVGDFENVLAAYGKTKEDFAVEVTESLLKFVDEKISLFESYDDYEKEGLCVVYKGVYAIRGGSIYIGETQETVYDDGSITAAEEDNYLYISSDTDLHFFEGCEFSRAESQDNSDEKN